MKAYYIQKPDGSISWDRWLVGLDQWPICAAKTRLVFSTAVNIGPGMGKDRLTKTINREICNSTIKHYGNRKINS